MSSLGGERDAQGRRRMGRPPNQPKPPLPENPIQIAPRPQSRRDSNGAAENPIQTAPRPKRQRDSNGAAKEPAPEIDEDGWHHYPTPPAAALAAQAAPHTREEAQPSPPAATTARTHRASRRGRGLRRINLDQLAADEISTDVNLLTAEGVWVTLPGALISPHYPQCFMPARTAELLGHHPRNLTGANVETFVTPRGRIQSTRAVVLWFELQQLQLPRSLVPMPVLDGDDPGVSIILGRPFIEWYFGPYWPPPQYVEPDVALSLYNGDFISPEIYDENAFLPTSMGDEMAGVDMAEHYNMPAM
ncbi:hypothetical protein B0T19DRAFT_92500 [Cercophora scortea]|uniref:Uncharacterized protein n=1 Tax=Cercophora scortea TaxID=314031 RepID=A0AAE0IW38_9PEZI|nr:hypothetical protein B0T19DRAFT_92500 [Cercophora scortea]